MIEEARRFPGQERQVIEFFRKKPEALARLRAPIFEDKTVDFILEVAEISEREVARDELMRNPESPAPGAA
jgi:trigger factor